MYNEIDTELFKPNSTHKWENKLGFVSNHVFINTGRLTKEKGIHLILDASYHPKYEYEEIQILKFGAMIDPTLDKILLNIIGQGSISPYVTKTLLKYKEITI